MRRFHAAAQAWLIASVFIACASSVPTGPCTVDHGGCPPSTVCEDRGGTAFCNPCGADGGGSVSCAGTGVCATNNGGCDPHVVCTAVGSSAFCGPCPAGYTGNGTTGCVVGDACATSNGGCDPLTTCSTASGTVTCSACPAGYTGTGKTACVAPNACSTANGGCDPLTTCTDTTGSVACGPCPTGYTGTGLQGCTAVSACMTANGGCDPLTTCTDTGGTVTCGPCPTGYTGTGLQGCTPTNACLASHGGCDSHVTCSDTAGGVTCGPCPTGWGGTGQTHCIGPCEMQSGLCTPPATCEDNAAGGYTCSACPSGYVATSGGSCLVDVCSVAGATCPTGSLCVSDPAGLVCPGAETASATPTAQQPGMAGGTAYVDTCGAGEVVTGYQLMIANGGGSITEVETVCGSVSVDASGDVTIGPGATTFPLRGDGVTAASPASATCPANQVVTGFEGDSGWYLDLLTLHCAPLTLQIAAGQITYAAGASTAIAGVGNADSNAFAEIACPTGQVAVGTNASVGDDVNLFGLSCASLAPCDTTHATQCPGIESASTTPTAQQPGMAGGTSYTGSCGTGQAVIGYNLMIANGGGSITEVQTLCGVLSLSPADSPTATVLVSATGATQLPLWGDGMTASAPATAQCPPNQVVVGFEGESGWYLDELTLHCAPLSLTMTGAQDALAVGTQTAIATVGNPNSTAFPAIYCPTGQVAVGTNVSVGDDVNLFGLSCAPTGP